MVGINIKLTFKLSEVYTSMLISQGGGGVSANTS